MAIKDYINVSYTFENEKELITNSHNYFTLIIQPLIDLSFESVSCLLRYQIIGKTSTNSNKIATLIIDRNNDWKKNKNYSYDASLPLGDLPLSYNGMNFQVIWWICLEVNFNSESQSHIRNLFLKDASLVNLLKSFDGKHTNKNLVTLSSHDPKYDINPFSVTYKIDPYLHLIIGCFILILSLIFFLAELIKKYIWIPTLIGLGFSSYGIYQAVGIGLLKKVHFKGLYVNNEYFELEVTVEKNYKKIDLVIVSYEIIEEVIDNRGTTSTSYREAVYESKEIILKDLPSQQFNVKLNYPKRNIPLDFQRDDIRFYAQIKVKLEFTNKTKGLLKQGFPLTRIS